MKVFIAKCIAVVVLFFNTALASPDKLFLDFVNYSASIDGYSSLCIKNYNDEKEMTNLFILLNEIKLRGSRIPRAVELPGTGR